MHVLLFSLWCEHPLHFLILSLEFIRFTYNIFLLWQDVTNLRRDINLTKHVMQADYESKLQEKSLEL